MTRGVVSVSFSSRAPPTAPSGHLRRSERRLGGGYGGVVNGKASRAAGGIEKRATRVWMSSRVTVHAAQLTEGGVTDRTPVAVVCTHVCMSKVA